MADGRRREPETPELRRLRRRIDSLDRRLVALLNERAELARDAGRAKAAAGRRAIRDADREREVLLRVTMANQGPMPQADLLALYRRLMAATRALEAQDRRRMGAGAAGRATGRATGEPRRGPGPGRRSGDPDPLRPGTDRLPPPRPRRQRRLRVGTRRGRRRRGPVPDRGPRRAAQPPRVRRRADRGPGLARVRARRRARSASATTTPRTPRPSTGCGPTASSTAATARGRRSSAGPRMPGARGTDRVARVPVATAGSTARSSG